MDKEELINFKNYSETDIIHKINAKELSGWISHLTYIEKELLSLIGVYSKNLSIALPNDRILGRLAKKRKENEILLNALNKYSNIRKNLRECDDMQCDTAFMEEHESYRTSYAYHLDKYRRLKDAFYKKAQNNLTIGNHN